MKTISKFIFLSIFCVFTFSFLTGKANSQSVMRIAAVVNDDIISAHDLGQRIRLTITLGRMQDSQQLRLRLAREILRSMVNERLILQEIERLEIEISDKQLQEGIKNFARIQRIKPELFGDFLESIDVDPLIVEDQARAEIGWSIAVRRLGGNRLNVSDKEIEFALQKRKENEGKPEYLYSEIYLPVDVASEEAEARQNAQRLIQFIKSGSPFATLARDFSKSASAVRGGDLGWVQSGNIPPEIEAALTSLPVGSYSNPIRTASGIYIIHNRDKRIAGAEQTDDIFKISQIVYPLPKNVSQDILNAKMNEARSVMRDVRSCENLQEIGQKMQNVQTGIVDDVKLSSTPVKIRTSLANMQPGQITTLNQNNRAIVTVMVCERNKAKPKPETLVKREIRNKIFAEKISLEERRQLKQLRRNAIVDIRL